MSNKVNIRPGVSMLSVLQHLNYKIWHAMAEFVDNSVESFLLNQEILRKVHPDNLNLVVRIDIDSSLRRISVKDNAAGIALVDFRSGISPRCHTTG